jgi:anti-sigma B factor antagonist
MNLAVREENEVAVVTPGAPLDFYSSPVFKKEMTALIEGGRTLVLIDLSGVTFVDSSGLGALLGVLRHATRQKGDLKLAGLRPNVKAVMELTRLEKMFEIFPDVPAALASFTSDRG